MRTIAVANQKGGCGKTTTAVSLAGCLAADGARVLIADLDPLAHASLAAGIRLEAQGCSLYEVLLEPGGQHRLSDAIVSIANSVDLVPSDIALGALEQRLAKKDLPDRTRGLASALQMVSARYDYALIDCQTHIGLLTTNALHAAQEVIVPVETSFFAIEGAQVVIDTIDLICERIGHRVSIRILPTLFDGRTRFARKMLAEIRQRFPDRCFDTVIRRNVKLREAAQRGVLIHEYAPSANGAVDYAALAAEVSAISAIEVDESLHRVEDFDLTNFPGPSRRHPTAFGD